MKRQELRRRRGAALVETALVLLVLIVITLAAFQYGWLFMCWQRVTNAARHGARMQAVLDAPPDVWDRMVALVDGRSAFDLSPDLGRCTITTTGGQVTAIVVVPAEENPKVQLLPLPNLLPVPNYLAARVTMAKEGQFPPGP